MHPTHHPPRGRTGRLPITLALVLALLLTLLVGAAVVRSWLDPLARQQAEIALAEQQALGGYAVVVAGAWKTVPLLAALIAIPTAAAIAWRRWGSRETLTAYYDAKQIAAQHQIFPSVTTYSPHHAQQLALPVPNDQQVIEGQAEPTTELTPDTEWRRWMDRAPHLLIAGRTEAGKTTLATALLIERALAGDQIVVLDPHYQPGKWAGVPTIGGGNNFEAILATLPWLVIEMQQRYKEFERGKPTEDFQRLTVLIDEVPAIVGACEVLTPGGRPKVVDPRWQKFAKRLGSEARKVRISVILLTQSTLVQDIQINSQHRENYLRVALGDQARGLLSEEPDRRRQQQLVELLRGQAHPAAMEWRGDFHLLDTSAVPDLAERRATAQSWAQPAPAAQLAAPAPPPPQSPAVPSSAVQAGLSRTEPIAPAPQAQGVPTTQVNPPTVSEQIVDLLAAKRAWMTSAEIVETLHTDQRTTQNALTKLSRGGAIRQRPNQRGGPSTYEYAAVVAA